MQVARPQGQGNSEIGPFRLQDPPTQGNFCRYKVTGISGVCPPLAVNGTVCVPCQANVTEENLCKPKDTVVNTNILSDDGKTILCTVQLTSLSKDCEACNGAVAGLSDTATALGLGNFTVDNQPPGQGEKFCRYKILQVVAPQPFKPKDCAVKKGERICIPCPQDNKCHVEGWLIFVMVKEGNGPACGVFARSLGGNCVQCFPGPNEHIIRPPPSSALAGVIAVLTAWGGTGGPGDLDGSGTVDFADLVLALDALGGPG